MLKRLVLISGGLAFAATALSALAQSDDDISIADETDGQSKTAVCNGVEVTNPGFGFGEQDFNLGCADQTILDGKGLDPSSYEQTSVRTDPPIAMNVAVLRALDKLTGRLTDLEIRTGDQAQFETLNIRAAACYKNPETETPESAAFLQVQDTLGETPQVVFSGWMYASSPSLVAMEHPIYDVWVVSCKN